MYLTLSSLLFLGSRLGVGVRQIFACATCVLPVIAYAGTCAGTFPPSNPDSVYVVNGNGTVTDTQSGLMWKVCSEGQTWQQGTCTGEAIGAQWANALMTAEASTFASQSGWRIPNLKELRSLVEECRTLPSINDAIFPATPNAPYWSSSPRGLDFAWLVGFNEGGANLDRLSSNLRVRLVRGGFSANNLVAVTPIQSANGIINPTNVQNITLGAIATFAAAPSVGYVAVWGGTCSGSASLDNISFITNAVTANCTVTASFEPMDQRDLINRYRIYIPSARGHLYTTDQNEYIFLTTTYPALYTAEGFSHRIQKTAITKQGQTAVPYYRLFIKTIGQHFWTTDPVEYSLLRQQTEYFSDNGIDGYIFLRPGVLGTIPLYRLVFFNTALHVWTVNENEFRGLRSRGWVAEGVPGNPSGVTGYVYPPR